MQKLAVVIVTFNSERYIKKCLDSLHTQSFRDFALVAVDNGSTDSTLGLIRTYVPEIKVLENKSNQGACKARNQGIEAFGSEWVLTLDCDVDLEHDFIQRLNGYLDTVPAEVGIIQPKIMQVDKKRIYSCGIRYSWLKRFFDIGSNQIDRGQFDAPRSVFGACAAAGVYRKKMLEAVKDEHGYFDERFFFLVEDVDLALRAQRQGWKALYFPEARCYHAGGSSGLGKSVRQYLCWRNRRLLLEKCEVPFAQAAAIGLLYDAPRNMLLFLGNRHVRNDIAGRSFVLNF